MKKVIFVQPAIPKYRIPFFHRLEKIYDVEIFSNKVDFLGVKSVDDFANVKWGRGFSVIFNKLFWHRRLPLIRGINKGDIVVVNGNPRILNYMLLLLLCKIRGIKTIWWGHGWSAGSYGFFASLRIKMMRIANVVLVYTEYEREQLGRENCYALNNGLDSDVIRQAIAGSNMVHHFSDHTRLLFVGRITQKANLAFVIEAMQHLAPKVTLSVIGDGTLKKELMHLAQSKGVAQRIIWYGAMFSEDDIARVMLQADVFVYPGSVGLSLIHAFNYGLPTVVHNSREMHMPEYAAFRNGFNGFGYAENDIESFCHAINNYAGLPVEQKVILRDNAFETVRKTFNVEDMVLRFTATVKNFDKK
ncbi:glycosyltransferase family 4 protein [Citrobacter koseri]|uniref:glycosyltransferase family 4 protein n=1 Tax=Citrobacter TaxID=544 RepID=UPI000E17B5A8|nr:MULTISPECIES: glycosyltransferase family 4 protein [Citrobacter]MBJ8671095.1 glycosyltransferase family 4 protein [Citrobacter koseri]MBJ8763987.1 glycosyltransferase family 4 protein [Citrobacter koseri]MBJ9119870.1 glycosyltransferase family 4 protein [Citrobacter koseri]MBJ9228766.1 glycosyltransferase family 4 protein [Citrobacter koseri]MDM3003073.1 glycosyltransferase family 4 protein [Citrobacter sp. CK188]